ncbi:MAG: protein kinase, partial [Deltaproteobacteria bacterium]|nr:protein kinase [Deltaproteobacteria bacterium]
MSELVGLPERIGRYEVLGLLGRGGMGRVVRGHDPTLHRDVALKLVEPSAVPPDALAEMRFLFHREARATAQLRHPGIIEIYDYSGPDADLMFIACELVEGPTLRDVLEQRGALAPALAAAVAFELAQALAHAHAHGIVHRDVKPENVFWLPSGRIVLSDFGIAKSLDGKRLGG